MITIYGMTDSGNCYKPRLLMAMLGRPFRHVEVNSLSGATRKPAFLAKNATARCRCWNSRTADGSPSPTPSCCYLAEGTLFLPADAYERALVYQWLFFEQYSHEPYVAVRRASSNTRRAPPKTPERLADTLSAGNRALGVMEHRLAESRLSCRRRAFGRRYRALCLYARRGPLGFELGPAVPAWLDRVRADPGHVPLDWQPAAA